MAYYERMDEAVRYGPVCRRDIRLYSEQICIGKWLYYYC